MLRWLWRFYRHCNHADSMRGMFALVVQQTVELCDRYELDCRYQQRGVMYVYRTHQQLTESVTESRFWVIAVSEAKF